MRERRPVWLRFKRERLQREESLAARPSKGDRGAGGWPFNGRESTDGRIGMRHRRPSVSLCTRRRVASTQQLRTANMLNGSSAVVTSVPSTARKGSYPLQTAGPRRPSSPGPAQPPSVPLTGTSALALPGQIEDLDSPQTDKHLVPARLVRGSSGRRTPGLWSRHATRL